MNLTKKLVDKTKIENASPDCGSWTAEKTDDQEEDQIAEALEEALEEFALLIDRGQM